jgi:xylulokinase
MYLGIDLGTSGVKSILIDDTQKIVAEQSSSPLAVSRPHRSWSEQNPEHWWAAVCQTLDGLAASNPPSRHRRRFAFRSVAGDDRHMSWR